MSAACAGQQLSLGGAAAAERLPLFAGLPITTRQVRSPRKHYALGRAGLHLDLNAETRAAAALPGGRRGRMQHCRADGEADLLAVELGRCVASAGEDHQAQEPGRLRLADVERHERDGRSAEPLRRR